MFFGRLYRIADDTSVECMTHIALAESRALSGLMWQISCLAFVVGCGVGCAVGAAAEFLDDTGFWVYFGEGMVKWVWFAVVTMGGGWVVRGIVLRFHQQ